MRIAAVDGCGALQTCARSSWEPANGQPDKVQYELQERCGGLQKEWGGLGLQALRFFAATSVVLYHAIYYAIALHIVPSEQIAVPSILSSGVTVFFALSGFLMAKISEVSSPVRFLSHRLLRIYPPFFLAVALNVATNLLIWGSFPPFDPVVVLSLFPGGQIQYPLGVEWTLIYEVFFYLVVTALCALPTIAMRQAFVVAWMIAIIVVNEFLTRSVTTALPSPVQIGFSYYNIAFIAGMAGWWLRELAERRAILLFVAGLALIVLAYGIPPTHISLWASSLGATFLVLGMATPRATALFSKRSVMVILGNGSYGIYLLHVSIVVLILATSATKGFSIILVSIAAAILIGAAFGVAEFNLYRTIVRRIDGEMSYKIPKRMSHYQHKNA